MKKFWRDSKRVSYLLLFLAYVYGYLEECNGN